MSQTMSTVRAVGTGEGERSRALRIVARSLYRDLREQGYQEQDVMAVAGELLELLANDVRGG